MKWVSPWRRRPWALRPGRPCLPPPIQACMHNSPLHPTPRRLTRDVGLPPGSRLPWALRPGKPCSSPAQACMHNLPLHPIPRRLTRDVGLPLASLALDPALGKALLTSSRQ